MAKVIRIILKANGRKDFHVRAINLSYRMRGRVARTQIKRIERRRVNEGKSRGANNKGEKKIVEVTAHIIRIFTYSAINSSANKFAPNSTLNPETSSDSPSAKSKGVRLVSARIVINQIMASGSERKRGGVYADTII